MGNGANKSVENSSPNSQFQVSWPKEVTPRFDRWCYRRTNHANVGFNHRRHYRLQDGAGGNLVMYGTKPYSTSMKRHWHLPETAPHWWWKRWGRRWTRQKGLIISNGFLTVWRRKGTIWSWNSRAERLECAICNKWERLERRRIIHMSTKER